MSNKINSFTAVEIEQTARDLENKGVLQSEINAVVAEMRKYQASEKNSTKGIKIALRRRGNKLGVSFEMNVDNQSVRLSNFTGTPEDLTQLIEVANKLGYTLN